MIHCPDIVRYLLMNLVLQSTAIPSVTRRRLTGVEEEIVSPSVRMILSLIGYRHLQITLVGFSGSDYDGATLVLPNGFSYLGRKGAVPQVI